MPSATILNYLVNKARLWRANGSTKVSVAVNIFWLALAWLFLPLESKPFTAYRAAFQEFYPQINPHAPKTLDCVRWLSQTLFLICFRTSARKGWLRLSISWAVNKIVAALTRLGDWVGHYGALALDGNHKSFETIDKKGEELSRPIKLTLLWILGGLAAALAVLCITQPFNIQGQVVFLSVMLLSALALRKIKARLTLMLLFVISMVVSGRYLWWRCTSTLNTDSAMGIFLSCLLLAAELYAFVVMVLGYFQVCWVLDRKPYPIPNDQALWPHVDIFIPTYNESLDVVKPTVFAALNLQWPADKLHVYILDDGSRPLFEEFAKQVGAGYIKREEHNHAKAGNINHAMTVTNGEFVTIFDCDHVPSSDFLVKTMGWLIKDPNIALVQTPHHFYSPDPFEKNLHLDRTMPIENSLFHDFIQKGNDTWNATMFCGSSAVMRRKALEEVGGIAVETVTEDAHTSLKLNRKGWSSAFIDLPLASGLSTETLAAHIGQRIRWARGMIQIFRLDNPFLGKGLSLPQRLCFFNAMFHFFHGLPRLIFLVAPLPYMFANVYVIYATAAAIFAYVLPHMIHSALTNQILQRGYRYPFLSGVYETVLSWYILLPTTVALIFPHKGKFNVTAKGGTIGEKYLDWPVSRPYLILIGLNMIGLLIGFYKAFFDPNPEYLTLAINMGWIAYNLMILGASMAVAVEEVQKHQFPRIHCKIDVNICDEEDANYKATMTQYSQSEVRLSLSGCEKVWKKGESIRLLMIYKEKYYCFKTTVLSAEPGNVLELSLCFDDYETEKAFNRCTFSREGMWIPEKVNVDDRMLTGFLKLGSLSWYGYKSMIEFLPGKLQIVPKVLSWCLTFAPRKPAHALNSNTL